MFFAVTMEDVSCRTFNWRRPSMSPVTDPPPKFRVVSSPPSMAAMLPKIVPRPSLLITSSVAPVLRMPTPEEEMVEVL
ncbi:hypothetical protein D3C71_1740010 [compost metagenome]